MPRGEVASIKHVRSKRLSWEFLTCVYPQVLSFHTRISRQRLGVLLSRKPPLNMTKILVSRKTNRYSAGNSPAISIRGGEPWLMGYCWQTQKCRNFGIPHACLEGKKAWETCTRKGTSRTLNAMGINGETTLYALAMLSGKGKSCNE